MNRIFYHHGFSVIPSVLSVPLWLNLFVFSIADGEIRTRTADDLNVVPPAGWATSALGGLGVQGRKETPSPT